MNIIDIQDSLKNFSEQQLVSEMQRPSGTAPQFLVLSEIQRRKRVRDDFAKREAANQPTVAQEAIAAAGVPQSGIMGMREAMNPKRTMVQNMRSGGIMDALNNDVIKAQSGIFFNDGMPTEELLRAIMMQESGGDPKARGSLDEVGAFQIRPSTALLPVGGKSMFPELAAQIGPGKKYKSADEAYLDNKEMIDSALEDIGKSRQFAGDYLAELRSRAGSDEGAIAAYNRGLGGLKGVKDPSQLDYFKGVSSFMPEQDTPSLIDRGKDLASSVVSGISDFLSPKEAIAQGVSNPSLAMQGRPFGIIDVAPPETDTEISMNEEMDKKIAEYAETEEYKQYVKRARMAGVKPKSPKERYAEITPNEEGVSPLDRFTLDTKDGGSDVVSVFEEGQGTIQKGGSTKDADEAVKKKQEELGLNVVKEFTSPEELKSLEDEDAEVPKLPQETKDEKTKSRDDSLPISSLEQQIIDLQNRLEKNREQDKYLALAQAGLAIMASDSPTLAGAIGEGGVDGLKAFREANKRYEEGVIDLINARAKLRGKTGDAFTANQMIQRAKDLDDLAKDAYDRGEQGKAREFEIARDNLLSQSGIFASTSMFTGFEDT